MIFLSLAVSLNFLDSIRLKDKFGRYIIFVSLFQFMCQISYSSQLAVILALNFNFLTVPGVVTPGSAASQIELIIYCSMISAIVSMAYFFGLINVYGDLRFRFASIVVCFHGRYNSCCSPLP